MSAENWMRQLEMIEKVRQAVHIKEKAKEAEQEKIRQEADERAWMRELGCKAFCQLKRSAEDEN